VTLPSEQQHVVMVFRGAEFIPLKEPGTELI
jgi:hypothetical protein